MTTKRFHHKNPQASSKRALEMMSMTECSWHLKVYNSVDILRLTPTASSKSTNSQDMV
jgi:hypothetical protein